MLVVITGVILILVFILILSLLLTYVGLKVSEWIERTSDEYDSLEYDFKEANRPYKCHCGIVSRYYQFSGHNNDICPQCNVSRHDYRGYSYRLGLGLVEDDREFPFAPKITLKEFKKMRKKKLELEKIEKEMQNIEASDKEIEAWTKLQLKKIAEYERKAEELKKELMNQC